VVNLKVTVLGEFTKQGNFLLEKENTTLIDIIGEAGGITARANPKTVKIIRGNRQSPEIIYVNLKDINSLANPKLILQNDDIIYMEPQGIYGTGERVQSFSTILQPVLLILNTALIIYNFTR
jgi:polysaccharide biosynthesis/export protein